MELYHNKPVAMEKLQMKKETLQNQLINIRGELSQASSVRLALSIFSLLALQCPCADVCGKNREESLSFCVCYHLSGLNHSSHGV